jgi:hypothetical protein
MTIFGQMMQVKGEPVGAEECVDQFGVDAHVTRTDIRPLKFVFGSDILVRILSMSVGKSPRR